ncbi:MAG: hypothetical protein V3R87_08245 [Dehalococcoidia bacterium]
MIFCPFILTARSKEMDFGNALQGSVCNKGQYHVVMPGNQRVLYQCALWSERKEKCVFAHIPSLAQ